MNLSRSHNCGSGLFFLRYDVSVNVYSTERRESVDKNPENWPGTGRDNKGRFVKGSSGNAGGRPKKSIVLDRLAKEALPELEAIAKDPATPVKVRSDIWRFFYEQKHGKAPQAIDLEGKMENTGTQVVKFEGVLDEWSQ